MQNKSIILFYLSHGICRGSSVVPGLTVTKDKVLLSFLFLWFVSLLADTTLFPKFTVPPEDVMVQIVFYWDSVLISVGWASATKIMASYIVAGERQTR